MKRIFAGMCMVGLAAGWMLSGCNTPPAPGRTATGIVSATLALEPGNQAELAAASRMETDRATYLYRLQVLQSYYYRVGNMDKRIWADKEIKNVQDAKTFTWEGLPPIVPPPTESVEGADERWLVENVISARADYNRSVEALAAFYEQLDPHSYKAKRIRNMQDRLDPVDIHMFFVEAELPPADLQPTEVIPEADKLFERGVRLFKEGKGPLHFFVTTDYDKERQAWLCFMKIVKDYPRSTKIALSAYYIADIYKEYFKDNLRAVGWYERAWTWDPHITEPARFQAATVYDYHLKNYSKAVECYRLCLRYDPPRLGNYDYARNRIEELTKAEPN